MAWYLCADAVGRISHYLRQVHTEVKERCNQDSMHEELRRGGVPVGRGSTYLGPAVEPSLPVLPLLPAGSRKSLLQFLSKKFASELKDCSNSPNCCRQLKPLTRPASCSRTSRKTGPLHARMLRSIVASKRAAWLQNVAHPL